MLLAKEINAYTSEGQKLKISAFTEVKDIKKAADRGFWFDVCVSSFFYKTWQRVWADKIATIGH